MTFNLKQANEDKYPIEVNGKMLSLSGEQISHLIKKKMRGDLAVQKLFEKFEVSLDQLEDLNIEIVDLSGMFAETELKAMYLDEGLFSDGQFFKNNWFTILHELVHWLSRWKEDQSYLSDPEETLGFCASIATEIARGTDMNTIWNLVYPRIEFHFHDESDAREFFIECIEKAKQLLM